jgi:hypothetical protein
MMKNIFFVIVLATLFLSTSVQADPRKGNFWYQECENGSANCGSYMLGLVSGIRVMNVFLKSSGAKPPYCRPKGVKLGQDIRIFWRHMHNNPEERHLDAGGLYISAMIEAFPCN